MISEKTKLIQLYHALDPIDQAIVRSTIMKIQMSKKNESKKKIIQKRS